MFVDLSLSLSAARHTIIMSAVCRVTHVAWVTSLYALLSLWTFFILFKNNIIRGVHRHSRDRVWVSEWNFRHVSEIHSETISGRSSLSHYWTALALSNGLLGLIHGSGLNGAEQVPLFFLALFPLRSPADPVCGFVPLAPRLQVLAHYGLVILYFGLSLVVLILDRAWWDTAIQTCFALGALSLLARGSPFATEWEALTSTYISFYYLRVAAPGNGCG